MVTVSPSCSSASKLMSSTTYRGSRSAKRPTKCFTAAGSGPQRGAAVALHLLRAHVRLQRRHHRLDAARRRHRGLVGGVLVHQVAQVPWRPDCPQRRLDVFTRRSDDVPGKISQLERDNHVANFAVVAVCTNPSRAAPPVNPIYSTSLETLHWAMS